MFIYYKGHFHPERVTMDPQSLHFRYGAGFFEALYYNGHMIRHLDPHVARLHASLDRFSISYAKVAFDEVIGELLIKNDLARKTAHIEIIYPITDFAKKAEPLIMAHPHTVDEHKLYTLGIYPRVHQSYLNAYRTTSSMHHCFARQHAHANGHDDCVMVDAESNVMEASGASLVFGDGKSYVVPKTDYAMRSSAVERAMNILSLRDKVIPVTSLGTYKHAWVISSLIGMRPVTSIGEFNFVPDEKTASLVSMNVL